MEIIIEYVLLDNFAIDALLLYAVVKTLRLPIHKWGIVLAALFGAGFALVSPLIPATGIVAVIIKLFVALIMCYMACISFYKLFYKFLLFTLYTFAFGGALIGIFTYLHIPVYDSLSLGYVSRLPLGAILACGCAFFILIMNAVNALYRHKKFATYMCPVCISIHGKSANLRGFLDTGNTLHDKGGRSVVVVSEKTLSKWFAPHERLALILGRPEQAGVRGAHYINVSGIGKDSKMLVFDAESLELNNRKHDVAIGIMNVKNKTFSNFDVILSPDLVQVSGGK